MDDALYRSALIVFHQELGLPLIEAGRFASAIVVWSAETPKARAAVLEFHGPALRASDTGRSEAEAMREACIAVCEKQIAYLEDPRRDNGTCMSYGRGELQSAIHLIRRIPAAGRTALNLPAGQGEPETHHPHEKGEGL